MAVISFKSVGKTRVQQNDKIEVTELPIGIITPLQLGDKEIFKLNFDLVDQIQDNLKNLILTNWGERLGLYDFGGNLRSLCSEFVSQDNFDASATTRIAAAVAKYMPYISLLTFESKIDHKANAISNGTSVIKLNVVYAIPSLQVSEKTLEVTLYVI